MRKGSSSFCCLRLAGNSWPCSGLADSVWRVKITNIVSFQVFLRIFCILFVSVVAAVVALSLRKKFYG